MRYIPPKKVRAIYLIALLPALLLTVIGGNIQSKPVMFTGIGIALLALIFYWRSGTDALTAAGTSAEVGVSSAPGAARG